MDYSPGLRGVVAGETAISTVGKEGTSLRYRGYDATELTSNNTYEEVASLILTNTLEDKNFKKSFSKYYLETTKDNKLNELLLEIKEKNNKTYVRVFSKNDKIDKINFKDIKNLYLVGGGTHPGSGLPTIYQSAIITANYLKKV